MACLLGMLKDVPHSSGLPLIDLKVKLMWPPVRHTSFKRGGVWDLCVTPCHPGSLLTPSSPVQVWLTRRELIPSVFIRSKPSLQMMIATSQERLHVFIPLEFMHHKDTRPLWRMAFFTYLNGVWEWVQVTSDHSNHYTFLAHTYAAAKASSPAHSQVSSTAPPTECSLAVTLSST